MNNKEYETIIINKRKEKNTKNFGEKGFKTRNNFRNNPNKFSNKTFEKKQFNQQNNSINSFSEIKSRDYFKGIVKIVRKTVPGPVVFSVSDGYYQLDAVTKESEFQTNDVVNLRGEISDRGGKFQIEIDKIEKSEENFDKILDEKSNPINRNFSINSKRFNIMKHRMLEIAKRIRRAIIDGEAIIIRHHSDTDGISSGLALEHSIKNLMRKIGVNPQYNLYRSVSKAPFYEISDVLHDVALAKRIVTNFGQKKPIFIITDNGSTPEDLFAHKTLHQLGYEVIVIDHHNPVEINDEKTPVCKYLSFHLNPYIFGLDSQTCAGMLSYEIARFIDEDYEEIILPAVSGISDRSDIVETEDYIKLTNLSREHLKNIGIAVDFVSYNMRFSSGEGLYEEIFSNKTMVEIMINKVNEGMETQLQSTLPYVKTHEIHNIIFSHIDLEKYTVRFKYPTPGKVIGMIHDKITEEKTQHAVLTIGYLSDMIIIRANKPILPVETIIKNLKNKYPQANVDGGGHECAGTIKFVSAHLDIIIEEIKTMLKELKQEID